MGTDSSRFTLHCSKTSASLALKISSPRKSLSLRQTRIVDHLTATISGSQPVSSQSAQPLPIHSCSCNPRDLSVTWELARNPNSWAQTQVSQHSALNKPSRWFWCTLKFESPCSKLVLTPELSLFFCLQGFSESHRWLTDLIDYSQVPILVVCSLNS